MPAFDSELMTKTSGDLTESESAGGIILRGTGIKGMAARVVVPEAHDDDDTLQVKVYDSDDDSTYDLVSQSRELDGFDSNPRDIIVPIVSNRKYGKIELIPSSTTEADIDFGAVKAGFVTGVGFDWERSESFE